MNNTMTHNTPVVMDVLPWPNGYGFTGADAWWQHTLNLSERERLDDLLGLALLDKNVCEQLVVQRDPALFDAFDLSEDTRGWLTGVQANTLKELALAVVAASNPYKQGEASEAA
jgi:hypothetical protein